MHKYKIVCTYRNEAKVFSRIRHLLRPLKNAPSRTAHLYELEEDRCCCRLMAQSAESNRFRFGERRESIYKGILVSESLLRGGGLYGLKFMGENLLLVSPRISFKYNVFDSVFASVFSSPLSSCFFGDAITGTERFSIKDPILININTVL